MGIPSSVTNIGEYAFKDNQLKSVGLPKDFISIGRSAFDGNQLESVELPKGLVDIGSHAFEDNQLREVELPKGVTNIGLGAFDGNQLREVELSKGLLFIGGGGFAANQLTEVELPNSLRKISGGAFMRNQLRSVELPKGLIKLGLGAFSDNQLTNMVLPNSLTNIRRWAFENNQLRSVELPRNLVVIEEEAFKNNRLGRVRIPSKVETIGKNAFMSNQLTNMVLPNSLKSIGGAFAVNQLTRVKLPRGLIRIMHGELGRDAPLSQLGVFEDNHLTEVELPKGLVDIGGRAFRNNQLRNVVIPDSVEYIGGDVFDGNRLTNNLVLPSKLKKIFNNTFRNNRLRSVEFPVGIELIANYTFTSNQLTNIRIPNSVRSIGDYAFAYNKLKSMEIAGVIGDVNEWLTQSIGKYAFYRNELGKVVVGGKMEGIEEYAFAENRITNIEENYRDKFDDVQFSDKDIEKWLDDDIDSHRKAGIKEMAKELFEGRNGKDTWEKASDAEKTEEEAAAQDAYDALPEGAKMAFDSLSYNNPGALIGPKISQAIKKGNLVEMFAEVGINSDGETRGEDGGLKGTRNRRADEAELILDEIKRDGISPEEKKQINEMLEEYEEMINKDYFSQKELSSKGAKDTFTDKMQDMMKELKEGARNVGIEPADGKSNDNVPPGADIQHKMNDATNAAEKSHQEYLEEEESFWGNVQSFFKKVGEGLLEVITFTLYDSSESEDKVDENNLFNFDNLRSPVDNKKEEENPNLIAQVEIPIVEDLDENNQEEPVKQKAFITRGGDNDNDISINKKQAGMLDGEGGDHSLRIADSSTGEYEQGSRYVGIDYGGYRRIIEGLRGYVHVHDNVRVVGERRQFSVEVNDGNGGFVSSKAGMEGWYTVRTFRYENNVPITLDLDGDGLEHVDLVNSEVYFDMDGDGEEEHTAWVGADDGLLVYDYDEDGVIDKKDEISFRGYHENARTDLEGLKLAFDTNGDGVFDKADGEWEKFMVWQDKNQDGVSDEGELVSLDEAGIESIKVDSDGKARMDGDIYVYGESEYTKTDGTTEKVGDVAFKYEKEVEEEEEKMIEEKRLGEEVKDEEVKVVENKETKKQEAENEEESREESSGEVDEWAEWGVAYDKVAAEYSSEEEVAKTKDAGEKLRAHYAEVANRDEMAQKSIEAEVESYGKAEKGERTELEKRNDFTEEELEEDLSLYKEAVRMSHETALAGEWNSIEEVVEAPTLIEVSDEAEHWFG